MRIRKWKPEDASQIKRLHYGTVNAINTKDYTQEQRQAWSPRDFSKNTMERSRRFFGAGISYVAVEQRKIVGYTMMTQKGELKNLYVHKDHQGEGIGTALLRKIEEEARRRGIREISLESTITARSFYQQQGYEDLGKTEKLMREVKLPVVRMKKKLNK